MPELTNLQVLEAALNHTEAMGLRRAGTTLGVSHERVATWREAKKNGTLKACAATLQWETRQTLIKHLDALPAKESPTYSQGVEFAIGKVEVLLAELRLITGANPTPISGDGSVGPSARRAKDREAEALLQKTRVSGPRGGGK